MENETVVNEELTTPVSEDVKTNTGTEAIEGTFEPEAGGKTDPNLLLKSLREEREKRRDLEERLEQLENLQTSTSSEEDDLSEVKSLKKELSEIKQDLHKKDLFISYPILKEKWEEFEEFRTNDDNKGMNMRTAAKAYLVENGLLEPTRKGLEKPTGGTRQPLQTGMTAEDVDNLRKNNFEKYRELLKKGQIKIQP
jgi:hypothetical protein